MSSAFYSIKLSMPDYLNEINIEWNSANSVHFGANWTSVGSISASIGEYAVVRTKNGVRNIFYIYFLRGSDGVWRIDEM